MPKTVFSRRTILRTIPLAVGAGAFGEFSFAEEPTDKFNDYPESVAKYLQRIYDEGRAKYAYRKGYPGGFERWQEEARYELEELIGLNRIALDSEGHTPRVELAEPGPDLGGYTRQKGFIETEPHIRIPFWLLRPTGEGPFPLAVMPHGHSDIGLDTYAGVVRNEAQEKKMVEKGYDVAVQAAKRRFLAIAPATRGLSEPIVPDLLDRHGGRDCRSHLIHCLLARRTAIGERVWDMKRIIDWAEGLEEVDPKRILMMGNSGGGVVTLYASACDERIRVAVPSCSFSLLHSEEGYLYHCDCNLVPGMVEWGELFDVAGLVAPRALLVVNGKRDGLHLLADMERATERAAKVYEASGHPEKFAAKFGEAGHQFYPELMWPFVMKEIESRSF